MRPDIPPSYIPGVQHIKSLTQGAMIEWLKAELSGRVHVLAGQQDDFPVQAILNHAAYLELDVEERLKTAVRSLVLEWRENPAAWSQTSSYALMDLASELPVEEAKGSLMSFTLTKAAALLDRTVLSKVFQAVAALSVNSDTSYWSSVPETNSQFTGMAFQVLARIAPKEALSLLHRIPENPQTLGGVARELADLVSSFPLRERQNILADVAQAIERLSNRAADALRTALAEEGFDIPLLADTGKLRQERAFEAEAKRFGASISRASSLQPFFSRG